MSGMTDILMIGLLAVGGYYLLMYSQQQQTTGTTTPITYTDPAPVTTEQPTFETQCDQEGGKWQGSCCSCPNQNCTEKCGSDENEGDDVVEACESEDGLWQVNRPVQCCSCPNKHCSFKCGTIDYDPSGGGSGKALTEKEKAKILCESEGDNNVWKPSGNFGCCQCANRVCKNKCKSTPAKVQSKGSGKAQPSSPPPKKPAPKGAVTLKKPVSRGITPAKPSKVKQCAGLTGAFKTACLNSYAHAYLAGSSNRLGPSYTHRDDFRHISNVEFPSHLDFEYQAAYRPYYLGPRSPERHELLRRFQSNFSTMKFSG